jgi:hypothetical protein
MLLRRGGSVAGCRWWGEQHGSKLNAWQSGWLVGWKDRPQQFALSVPSWSFVLLAVD